MVPDYEKAALGLHPFVPTYAVDCDDDGNKRLCEEQGLTGFPTIKVHLLPPKKSYGTANSQHFLGLAVSPWKDRARPDIRRHQRKKRERVLLLGFTKNT